MIRPARSTSGSAAVVSSAPSALRDRQGTDLIDAATLMRIKTLEMRARIVVQGYLNGANRSPNHGFSVEFTEYRQYTPGDDPRHLDWKLYARSDRFYLKRFEDETNFRCLLLLDVSKSMEFGSLGYSKGDYAATLAATFAYFLAGQRDAVGLLSFAGEIRDFIPPRYRAGHLHRMLVSLERKSHGTETNLKLPIERAMRHITHRGVIVLLSDLLAPLDTFDQDLGCLAARGHDVVVMRIADPAERDLTFDNAALFEDLETGRKLHVDPNVIRAEYRKRWAEHTQAIEKACARHGASLFQINTDQPLELALTDFLHRREHTPPLRGRTRTGKA